MSNQLVIVQQGEIVSFDYHFNTVVPGSTTDITFNVQNTSDAYTAGNVTLSIGIPEVLLSLDGRTFSNSISLGSLLPGASSPLVTLRLVIPTTATAGSRSDGVALQATWS